MTETTAKRKQQRVKSKLRRTKVKQKHDKDIISELDPQKMREDILNEAKVLGMAATTTEVFVSRVVDDVIKWLKKRPAVTYDDLNRKIAAEVKKYNEDLAYVYQNRGKII